MEQHESDIPVTTPHLWVGSLATQVHLRFLIFPFKGNFIFTVESTQESHDLHVREQCAETPSTAHFSDILLLFLPTQEQSLPLLLPFQNSLNFSTESLQGGGRLTVTFFPSTPCENLTGFPGYV